MYKQDETDKPVYRGRFNIGAITLHLPMIYMKAKEENKDFFEVYDCYLEMIRELHRKTYNFLAKKKASQNPLCFCQGGLLGGNLDPDDTIEPLLKTATASFGYTALNELEVLATGKTLVEDGSFSVKVLEHLNKRIEEYKKEDSILYAIYGTPAESLCSTQIEQFRAKYGIIEGVSSREYVSNSFHCGVWEEITPVEKQDIEEKFWHLTNGGKIQHIRFPIDYNFDAMKTLVRRGMDKGYYQAVNMDLSYCNDCGYEQLEMDKCPKCDSDNLTKINRMNGYLSYSQIGKKTRLNDGKLIEISERKSM